MTRQVGDAVFSRSGKPGVVLDRDAATGRLKVERAGEGLDKVKKRGYINGLNTEERAQYNEIRDKVLEKEKPKEKVETLVAHLDELKANPKNHNLSKYVEADLAHTMITFGINPKTYEADEHHVR
jgi:phosphoenolpyruvate synthase/pyruvate phosphate dikinase